MKKICTPLGLINSFTVGFVCGLLTLAIMSYTYEKPKEDCGHAEEIGQLKYEKDYYKKDSEILHSHARRMKFILGIPDTVEWSYATKCKYSINTRKLTKLK